jgi:hypothetical protein
VFLAMCPRFVGELEERSLAFPLDRLMTEVGSRAARVDGLVRLKGESFRPMIQAQLIDVGDPVPRAPYPYRLHRETGAKITGQELRVLGLCDGRTHLAGIIERLSAEAAPMGQELVYPIVTEALRKGVLVLD